MGYKNIIEKKMDDKNKNISRILKILLTKNKLFNKKSKIIIIKLLIKIEIIKLLKRINRKLLILV